MHHLPANVGKRGLLQRAVRVALCGLTMPPCGLFYAALAAALPATTETEPFPALYELASLLPDHGGDGSEGMIMDGSDAYFSDFGYLYDDVAGRSVALTGDMNGDGIGDMLIGAYRAEPGPDSDLYGAAYVVFGTDEGFPAQLALESLFPRNGGDGSRGFVLAGEASVWGFGRTVSSGDFNGDGLSDLLLGAVGDWGRGYIIFGTREPFPPLLEVASLLPVNGGDGSRGVVFDGASDALDIGDGVAAVGDVNGDGIEDLALGGPNANASAGQVALVFGRREFAAHFDLGTLLPENGGDGSDGVIINGRPVLGRLGKEDTISGGDINGDKFDDLVLGAYLANETNVVFGLDTWPPVLELSSLLPESGGSGETGFILRGIDAEDYAGNSTSVGDINGDGFADIVVGSHAAGRPDAARAGESYVVFGKGNRFPAVFELSRLLPDNGGSGDEGFVVYGVAEGDEAGIPVSARGDLNADGIADLVIGGDEAGTRDQYNLTSGQVYVIYGRPDTFAAEFELASLLPENGGDGSTGVVFDGIDALDYTGHALSTGHDVNGDGIDDLLIGVPQQFDGYTGFFQPGRAYIVFGRAPDSDNDGVPDERDNCVLIVNPDQRDTNHDGIGNICDADLNNDCLVNFGDLGLMRFAFLRPGHIHADLNGDGAVNFGDLGLMKASFFSVPGPSGIPNTCADGAGYAVSDRPDSLLFSP